MIFLNNWNSLTIIFRDKEIPKNSPRKTRIGDVTQKLYSFKLNNIALNKQKTQDSLHRSSVLGILQH